MDTTQSLTKKPAEEETACCSGEAALTPPELVLGETDALAERLKALADPTRLRMLDLLARQSAPLCVCEINE